MQDIKFMGSGDTDIYKRGRVHSEIGKVTGAQEPLLAGGS